MAFHYVLPHAVTVQLDSLRRRIRQVAFLRGCGLFLPLSCGLLVATMLTDFLFDLEPASRTIGFVAFCLTEIVLFAFLLVRPVVVKLQDAEVASLAEERFPELGERVSSLVELSDPDIPEGEKGSPLMRGLLEEETVKELARCDFNDAVSSRPAIKRLGYGVGTLLFLVLSLLIFPSVSSLLLARLFKPWGNYESVSRLIFEIEGADEYVARGSDIEIAAKMAWRNGSDEPIPEPVELSWKSDDGNSDVRPLSFDPDQDAFTTTIPGAQDSLELFVSSAGSRSKRYRINVLDRPEVLTAQLEVTPPGYLGQPRETIDGVTGAITVFEHSQLALNLTFSHPVTEASIEWLAPMVLPESELAGDQQIRPAEDDGDDGEAQVRRTGSYSNSLVAVDSLPPARLAVSEDGLSAQATLNAEIQGAFLFRLKESHGLQNAAEPHRQLTITRDQPPILEVPGSDQDRARPTDVYGIRVSAVDDVALEELELHVTSREGLDRVLKAPSELLGQESLEHEFRIDLADIAVKSGDFLKLQIRVADGRPVPEPNEVWSDARYVAISDEASAQGTGDVLARQQRIRQEIQDIRDQLREAVEQSDDLKRDAQQSLDNNRQFAQQNAVEKLAGREEELAARIAELADQFSQHPLFGNLSEDLWSMAAEQLDPVAVKVAESNSQELKEQVATLDENSTVADIVEEGLAAVAEKFDELAELEKDLLELNRIAQRAKQLADDAVQLEQRRDELVSAEANDEQSLEAELAQNRQETRQDLAENQQMLMEEQSELMAALDNLMQQRPELLDAARDHQLEKLAELARQASRIAEPQELLAESLKNDAERLQNVAAPLTERQQEIAEQVEELAARTNAQQARQPVAPIDPELARRIADELRQGNFEQAVQLSEQAEQDLAALAKELVENTQLPDDPKEAAAELAKRQQALADELATVAESQNSESAESVVNDNPAESTKEADLGQFAARQAALQMAAAQLQTDRQARDEQQTAVNETAETLQKLIEAAQESGEQTEAIRQAAQQGQEAANALKELAENVRSEEQQREEALDELQRLRKENGEEGELPEQELAARLQELLDPTRPEPEQVAQQASQLAEAQEQLRNETETLDDESIPEQQNAAESLAEQQAALAEQAANLPPEIGALERSEALAELDQAQQALEAGQLGEATNAQQQAQQALENFAREAAALAQSQDGAAPTNDQAAAGDEPGNAAQAGEELAAQAERLAGLQEELQQAISELTQQPAGEAVAAEQVADGAAPTTDQPAGTQPDADAPARQQPESGTGTQSVQELLAQQEELTAQAAQLALQAARQAGAESPATQAATQAAQQSAEAETAAQGGQFDQAAQEASNAQQAASTAMEALQEAGPALADRAQQLAQRQQQMAEAFQQLENAPAQRAAAQQAQQQDLAAQADEIARALDELAGQLGAQPLDLEEQGRQASAAQQSALQGQQAADQAAQSMQAGNQGQAAQSAQQAAEALRQTAQQAFANAQQANSQSPVPGEFAAQIADAMRQLQQAQQQLAQAAIEAGQSDGSEGQPGSETGSPGADSSQPGAATLDAATGESGSLPGAGESSDGQPTPAQSSPGESDGQTGEASDSATGSPSGESGQQSGQSASSSSSSTPSNPSTGGPRGESANPGENSSLADAAEALQQAAENLSNAAQQLAADGSQSGNNAGQGNQAPSNQPQGLGNSGTGAFVAGDVLGPLDTELKRQAMKNWGKLSGTLKTEILQSSQRKANGDYAKLIKLYFEELAKAGQTSSSNK